MSALLEPLLLSDQRCLPINNAERRFEEDSVSFSARQLKLVEALLDVRLVSKDVEFCVDVEKRRREAGRLLLLRTLLGYRVILPV